MSKTRVTWNPNASDELRRRTHGFNTEIKASAIRRALREPQSTPLNPDDATAGTELVATVQPNHVQIAVAAYLYVGSDKRRMLERIDQVLTWFGTVLVSAQLAKDVSEWNWWLVATGTALMVRHFARLLVVQLGKIT